MVSGWFRLVRFNAVEHAGGGVTMTFKAHVTSRTNSAATHRFALRRTVILFFQRDNEPKHTSRLDRDGLTNRESGGVSHDLSSTITPTKIPTEKVWAESHRRAKDKQPKGAQGTSRNSFRTIGKLFQVTTSWLRERREGLALFLVLYMIPLEFFQKKNTPSRL